MYAVVLPTNAEKAPAVIKSLLFFNHVTVPLFVITEALVEDKNVRLVDFGTFEVKQRAERMGHNPKTGEKLKIEAKEIVTFKQGKALGEQLIVKPKQKSKAKKKA